MKLSDNRSVQDAEQFLLSIEKRLTNRINEEHRRAAPHKINSELQHAFDNTLDALKDLLKTIPRYQTQQDRHKRTRTSRRPSLAKENPVINNKPIQPKSHIVFADDDDDKSSDASHSSIGDEVLMELARIAYEKKPTKSIEIKEKPSLK